MRMKMEYMWKSKQKVVVKMNRYNYKLLNFLSLFALEWKKCRASKLRICYINYVYIFVLGGMLHE